jgi:hypothetical protein
VADLQQLEGLESGESFLKEISCSST